MRTHGLGLLVAMLASAAAAQPLGSDFVPREVLVNPLTWKDVERRKLPDAGEHIAYGPLPQQFGELRVPKGRGPFPVAVLVHGGCWLADFDLGYMRHLAAALAKEGIASWSIEYRRIGDAGGGWPGTFEDVAAAADYLRVLAQDHPLDLKRVGSAGHSAGGQLALWLAARPRLATGSALYRSDPLRLRGAVGLAPITDLATYRNGSPGSCNASVDQLLGGTPQTQPQRYAQTSPLALLPLGVPQWLVQGERDSIVPPAAVQDYAARAQTAGDRVSLAVLARAGHFEVALPEAPARDALLGAIHAAVGLPD